MKYDIWLASWSSVKPKSPIAGIWQFGGETNKLRSNKIAGITCDQDYAYKDYPSIMKQKSLNGYSISSIFPFYKNLLTSMINLIQKAWKRKSQD